MTHLVGWGWCGDWSETMSVTLYGSVSIVPPPRFLGTHPELGCRAGWPRRHVPRAQYHFLPHDHGPLHLFGPVHALRAGREAHKRAVIYMPREQRNCAVYSAWAQGPIRVCPYFSVPGPPNLFPAPPPPATTHDPCMLVATIISDFLGSATLPYIV